MGFLTILLTHRDTRSLHLPSAPECAPCCARHSPSHCTDHCSHMAGDTGVGKSSTNETTTGRGGRGDRCWTRHWPLLGITTVKAWSAGRLLGLGREGCCPSC